MYNVELKIISRSVSILMMFGTVQSILEVLTPLQKQKNKLHKRSRYLYLDTFIQSLYYI